MAVNMAQNGPPREVDVLDIADLKAIRRASRILVSRDGDTSILTHASALNSKAHIERAATAITRLIPILKSKEIKEYEDSERKRKAGVKGNARIAKLLKGQAEIADELSRLQGVQPPDDENEYESEDDDGDDGDNDTEPENTTRSPKKSRESLRTPSPYCAAASSSSSSSSASSSAPPVLPTMATLNFGPPRFTRPDLPGSSLALAMVDDEGVIDEV
mmetsp:Transcript_4115/g.7144  ORF Transcript_4115/g.7144 Transcript_4115/m.7144 type:complete len:217 (+) Transcript_4115:38-688(+)